jgi:hypothetical protein
MTHAGAWAGDTARSPSRLREATTPPSALRAPTRTAPVRLAIALLGLPAPPAGGRLPTAVAAIPRLRRDRRKRLLAAFQQTPPRPRPRRPTRRLPRTKIWLIVGRAHGRGLSSPAGQVPEESFDPLLRGERTPTAAAPPALSPSLYPRSRAGCHGDRRAATAGFRVWVWTPTLATQMTGAFSRRTRPPSYLCR